MIISGKHPLASKNTLIRIPLKFKEKKKKLSCAEKSTEWTAKVDKIDGKILTCSVTSSAECCVGEYRMYTDSKITDDKSEDGRCISEYNGKRMILLFNPWCKGLQHFLRILVLPGNDLYYCVRI